MKNSKSTFLLIFIISGITLHLSAQSVAKIKPESFFGLIEQKQDSNTVLINFWATWCKPCVEELPYFMQLDSVLGDKSPELILLSFDSPSNPERVEKFIQKRGWKGTRYLLDATDLDYFINKINPSWQGNIPYTILLAKDKRLDHSDSFYSLQELIDFVNLKKPLK